MENLGKKAADKVTGLKGTLVSKHVYLYGSSRYGIQPEQIEGRELPKVKYFEEGRISIIE